MEQAVQAACPRCGAGLEEGQPTCPSCGAVAGQGQLNQIAGEALRLEQVNPPAAVAVWRQALDPLPAGSPPFQQIQQRIAALGGGWNPAAEIPQSGARPVRPPDPLPLALAKTAGSMLISIVVYYFVLFRNLPIAITFVVLMLIHEMGHVIATRYYRMSASPPIFIPFMGAVINLRESPPNAWVESVIGMGGPLLGTIGALGCYALAMSFPAGSALNVELLVGTQLAFILNLFNLLPVPPLDGGRITAAITPWLWILGLIGLGLLGFVEFRAAGLFGLFIPVLILLYAFPRIRYTLQARGMNADYYRVSRARSWAMGGLYVGLGLLLFGLFKHMGGYHFLEQVGL
jgi:Zn-dependent protease